MSITTSSALAQERFRFLSGGWDVAYRRAVELPAYATNAAEDVGTQLHLRIIELVSACVHLLGSGHYSAVPIIIRTTYEAAADQLALQRNPAHVKRMVKDAVTEGRAMPEMLNRSDPDLRKAFIADANARDFLRDLKLQDEQLEPIEPERMMPEQKFRDAGIPNEYPMFRFYSGPVHSDGSELSKNHLEPDETGQLRLTLFKVPANDEIVRMITLLAGNLIRSCRATHGENDPEFSVLWNQIVQFVADDDDRQT